jgi:hypothetical protein
VLISSIILFIVYGKTKTEEEKIIYYFSREDGTITKDDSKEALRFIDEFKASFRMNSKTFSLLAYSTAKNLPLVLGSVLNKITIDNTVSDSIIITIPETFLLEDVVENCDLE